MRKKAFIFLDPSQKTKITFIFQTLCFLDCNTGTVYMTVCYVWLTFRDITECLYEYKNRTHSLLNVH